VLTVRSVTGSAWSSRLRKLPVTSNPALLNAETLWNNPHHTARPNGSSIPNRAVRITNPMTSMIAVKMTARRVRRTTPPICVRSSDSLRKMRSRMPTRQPKSRNSSVVLVMNPKPPSWIRTRITACPKGLQCVAVSTGTSPVTHTADVATNSAITGDVHSRSLDDTGSMRRQVPTKIIAPNPPTSTNGSDATCSRGQRLRGLSRLTSTRACRRRLRGNRGGLRDIDQKCHRKAR
jgi:hypothetical protein